MARPQQALEELVRKASFYSNRAAHRDLLAGELVRWKQLARIQERYQACDNEFERRAIAREFKRTIPDVLARSRAREKSLDEVLDKLGPPGSADRVVNFFPALLWLPRGPRAGRPFRLHPVLQEPFVRDLYERQPDRKGKPGPRIYNRALYGGPVGCGKTPLGTGLGLFETVDSAIAASAVYGLASSREQAGADPHQLDRMHAIARYWVEDGKLRDWVTPGSTINCPLRRSFFKILPADGRRGLGVDPGFAVIEELSAFIYQAERTAFQSVRDRLHKRGPRMAALVAFTNAGYDKGTLLGEQFDASLEHPLVEAFDHTGKRVDVDEAWTRLRLRDAEGGFMFDWWGGSDEADLENPAVLRAINPLLSRESVGDLLRDLHGPDTDEYEWERSVGNRWTVAKGAWLPTGTWARLKDERVEIPPGAEISVAIDAAHNWDTTAIVWAWRRPEDGRVVVKAHVWTVRKDAAARKQHTAHEYLDADELDNEVLVEPFVLGFLREDCGYRIKHVVFDPMKLGNEAKHLADAGLTVAPLYPGSNRMREAENEFYKAKGGKLVHDGDVVLRSHVEATGGTKNKKTGQWQISKLFGKARPIDACVAAVMAHWAELILETDSAEPWVTV